MCELLLAEARQHLPPSAARALSASATPLAEAAAARELQVGRAALASVREEAAAVGQQLLPLRSPAELAILLQVELLYPLGTPKRSYNMLVELRTRGVVVPSQSELDLLLSRLHAWTRGLRSLKAPAEKRCVLVPPVSECVVCGLAMDAETGLCAYRREVCALVDAWCLVGPGVFSNEEY